MGVNLWAAEPEGWRRLCAIVLLAARVGSCRGGADVRRPGGGRAGSVPQPRSRPRPASRGGAQAARRQTAEREGVSL